MVAEQGGSADERQATVNFENETLEKQACASCSCAAATGAAA
jgi:hypothetical protein